LWLLPAFGSAPSGFPAFGSGSFQAPSQSQAAATLIMTRLPLQNKKAKKASGSFKCLIRITAILSVAQLKNGLTLLFLPKWVSLLTSIKEMDFGLRSN
jgi:hypothetical protein